MSTLFDLDDFEETKTEWLPILNQGIGGEGWHWPHDGTSIPRRADGSKISEAEWNDYLKRSQVCRDCGANAFGGAGGASAGFQFHVCDDCAQIDGCRVRECTTVVERRPNPFGGTYDEAAHCLNCGWFVLARTWDDAGGWVDLSAEDVIDACADHERPVHTSRWGDSHEIDAHDGLVAAQVKRRATFLSRTAGSA